MIAVEYLYKKFAKYYDLIYSGKDYTAETDFLKYLVKKHHIKGKDTLEVGCGTGSHAILLQKSGFNMTCIDLNKEMLTVARKKNRKIPFIQGDMRDFTLRKKFDIILCLFSTIHYNQGVSDLRKTIRNFNNHLRPGGLLIFDMGFNEERWDPSKSRDVMHTSTKELELVIFSVTSRKKEHGIFQRAYMLFKDGRFTFAKERHDLTIFRTPEVKMFLQQEGFDAEIHEGYSPKKWKPSSKKYVVFAAVKR
ncbi:class I SAM-dependent methyltransferase [Candidatus Woesearchaeota archaeon]|nr:class I SAM-dependent methyltransferase [Candidatus Woesearchaeota archaeon]